VAQQAKGTDVVQFALSSAFAHGNDVICVPETSAAGYGLHAVEAKSCRSCLTSGSLQGGVCGYRIDLAGGAASAITSEDLIAKITWIGAQTPLMDAVVAAEGSAAFGQYLKLAPAAERQTVRAFG
jgi:hypothetical protein